MKALMYIPPNCLCMIGCVLKVLPFPEDKIDDNAERAMFTDEYSHFKVSKYTLSKYTL